MNDIDSGEAGPVIHPQYLPFSADQLQRHFVRAGADGRHLLYYQDSAGRYAEHMAKRSDKKEPLSLAKVRADRQIEKDERFWIVACLMKYFHSANRADVLAKLLESAFGSDTPPIDIQTWRECLEGNLQLFFEVDMPSPEEYCKALREKRASEHPVPYVREAATRKSARVLEGPTQVDALLVNPDKQFAVLFEAKVLSDVSCHVSFDATRNQIARNVDVLLEEPRGGTYPNMPPDIEERRKAVNSREPERSLFVLVSPKIFKDEPRSRLYGWLMEDYRDYPEHLARDLCHRAQRDWAPVSKRLGWTTWEQANEILPGACGWLAPR